MIIFQCIFSFFPKDKMSEEGSIPASPTSPLRKRIPLWVLVTCACAFILVPTILTVRYKSNQSPIPGRSMGGEIDSINDLLMWRKFFQMPKKCKEPICENINSRTMDPEEGPFEFKIDKSESTGYAYDISYRPSALFNESFIYSRKIGITCIGHEMYPTYTMINTVYNKEIHR